MKSWAEARSACAAPRAGRGCRRHSRRRRSSGRPAYSADPPVSAARACRPAPPTRRSLRAQPGRGLRGRRGLRRARGGVAPAQAASGHSILAESVTGLIRLVMDQPAAGLRRRSATVSSTSPRPSSAGAQPLGSVCRRIRRSRRPQSRRPGSPWRRLGDRPRGGSTATSNGDGSSAGRAPHSTSAADRDHAWSAQSRRPG